MKREQLRELLMLGEGASIEFKSNCDPKIVGRQVCAFLNSGGGYVVCGISESGEPVGIPKQLDVRQFEQQVNKGISPKALISVELQKVEENPVLVVEVPAGKDFPYAFCNDIFVRVGVQTIKADIETIRDMVMRRQAEPERWERRFSSADLEADLDPDEIKSLILMVNKNSRMQFRDKDDPLSVLEELAMVKYGRLTNGGDVLFVKNPAIRSPQVRVQAVCFTSDKSDDTYQDMKSLEGPLVSVLEQVFSFIMRNTPTTSHFDKDNLQRQDEPVYPPAAVREGLVNAFAHRDYAGFSGGIGIHVYPKRLEIWNSGNLPEGVTPAKLATGHISVLRNPDIAHVLYLRGMMEKLGRGSVMIQKSCLERGLPRPEWRSDVGQGVTLTFFVPEGFEVSGIKSAPGRQQVTVPPGTKLGLSRDQVGVLRQTVVEQGIKDLMRMSGRSNRTKFRDQVLKPLLEAGLVEMTIPDKPTSSKQSYRITEQGKQYIAAQK